MRAVFWAPLSDLISIEAAKFWGKLFRSRRLFILDLLSDFWETLHVFCWKLRQNWKKIANGVHPRPKIFKMIYCLISMKFPMKHLYLIVSWKFGKHLFLNCIRGPSAPFPTILKSLFIIRFGLNLVWNTFIKHHHYSRNTASRYTALVKKKIRITIVICALNMN